LLGQCGRREFQRNDQNRTHSSHHLEDARRRARRELQVYRDLVQYNETSLNVGLSQSREFEDNESDNAA
jgi:hypothetical protein